MTNKQLANQIRKTKGKIFAWVNSANDGYHVAIDKADFIEHCLMVCPDSEATLEVKDNFLNSL